MDDYYIRHSDAINVIVSQAAAGDGVEQYNIGIRRAASAVDLIPAADVRPVVPGTWEHLNASTRSWRFRCSECGEVAYYPVPKYNAHGCGYHFCPNCGAKMEVTSDEQV